MDAGREALVEWLRRRLDEDEQAALATLGVNVRAGMLLGKPAPRWALTADGEIRDADGTLRVKFTWPDEAAHIVRHDPARVLRDVEAKRRLLEQFRLRGDSVRATVQPVTGGVWDDLLRLLALPYSDHPEYDDRWRL